MNQEAVNQVLGGKHRIRTNKHLLEDRAGITAPTCPTYSVAVLYQFTTRTFKFGTTVMEWVDDPDVRVALHIPSNTITSNNS